MVNNTEIDLSYGEVTGAEVRMTNKPPWMGLRMVSFVVLRFLSGAHVES